MSDCMNDSPIACVTMVVIRIRMMRIIIKSIIRSSLTGVLVAQLKVSQGVILYEQHYINNNTCDTTTTTTNNNNNH